MPAAIDPSLATVSQPRQRCLRLNDVLIFLFAMCLVIATLATIAVIFTANNEYETAVNRVYDRPTTSPPQTTKRPTQMKKSPTQMEKIPTQMEKIPMKMKKSPMKIKNSPTQMTKSPPQITKRPPQMTKSPTQKTMSPTERPLLPEQYQHEVVCRERSINLTKESLLTYFKNISGHQILTGLFAPTIATYRYQGHDIIKRISGKTPILLSIVMPKYLAEKDTWQSFANKVISHWKDGYLIHLVWGHIENPLGSMAILKDGNDTNWNDLTKDGGQLNEVWKKELDVLAVYLKQIQTAGVVPILDILPFINLRYALWSGRPGKDGSVKMNQITHEYLTNHHGLDSLIWTLSLDKHGGLSNLQDFWPGDQYVDVVVIYMWKNKELSSIEYQHVLDVANGKSIVMEGMESIPTYQMLDEQPRWTWFTMNEQFLVKAKEPELQMINSTFNHPKTFTKENCNK